MAMNFKVFDTAYTAANYVADLTRKQMNANPTSNIVFALNDEAPEFKRALKEEMTAQPVDASQINIFDYDNDARALSADGFVSSKVFPVKRNNDILTFVNEKDSENKKKGKVTMLISTITHDGSIGYRDVTGDADTGLLTAREIVLLVTGSQKMDAVHKLYNANEINTTFSAGNLKAHRMVTVVLDEAAAQGLPDDVRTYYYEMYS